MITGRVLLLAPDSLVLVMSPGLISSYLSHPSAGTTGTHHCTGLRQALGLQLRLASNFLHLHASIFFKHHHFVPISFLCVQVMCILRIEARSLTFQASTPAKNHISSPKSPYLKGSKNSPRRRKVHHVSPHPLLGSLTYSFIHYLCVDMRVLHSCGRQRTTCGNWFFPSTTWASEIKLRLLGPFLESCCLHLLQGEECATLCSSCSHWVFSNLHLGQDDI